MLSAGLGKTISPRVHTAQMRTPRPLAAYAVVCAKHIDHRGSAFRVRHRGSLDTDPLEWWPKYEKLLPSLSRMARQFLGVPASPAAVERLFSGVGQDFSKQRQSMIEETLEEVTWARSCIKDKAE